MRIIFEYFEYFGKTGKRKNIDVLIKFCAGITVSQINQRYGKERKISFENSIVTMEQSINSQSVISAKYIILMI